MSKLDEFKDFIKDKDYLINKVHNKELSWQELYETFDKFGISHELFKKKEIGNNNTLLSKENSLKTGSNILQGPHQVAKKSTNHVPFSIIL